MSKKNITRVSMQELATMKDRTKADAPPGPPLDADFWANASVVMPDQEGKERLTMRLDRDIVEFFRKQGRGYQTRMNAVLRSYVNSQRNEP